MLVLHTKTSVSGLLKLAISCSNPPQKFFVFGSQNGELTLVHSGILYFKITFSSLGFHRLLQ